MSWRARVARFLGLGTPWSTVLVTLRQYSGELTAAAQELRATSRDAVRLEQRVRDLEPQVAAWQRRLDRACKLGDSEIIAVTARVGGRLEGRLLVAREELGALLDEEIALRSTLIDRRRHWFGQVEHAQSMGLDVSGCVLEIDLTRPEPIPDEIDEDPEAAFVARILDGSPLH